MIMREIDATGDWTFGKGLSGYKKGLPALEQDLKTRLLSWKNDCFFAMQEGIDYQTLLDKGQQASLESAIKLEILQTEGVIGITPGSLIVVLDSTTRELSVQASIDTIYGRAYQIETVI